MTQTFTAADPATFEGTPYEVAARALAQIAGVTGVAVELLDRSEVMIRNAQLSRNLIETPDDARASEWDESAQARKLSAVRDQLAEAQRALNILGRAAGFDPKHPPAEL